MLFGLGTKPYLAREIVEPATGDHPAFLMGQKGEQVEILDYKEGATYPYRVEGPTNAGKPWLAKSSDLMFSRPMQQG